MVREADLDFGIDEALWRRIELKNLTGDAGDEVKPMSLRLQISTVREKHGLRDSVPFEKWNGIAEAKAGAVAEVLHQAVSVVCIDEPTKDEPGHALIAMVVRPGEQASMDVINATRALLAKKMKVVVKPTKTSSERPRAPRPARVQHRRRPRPLHADRRRPSCRRAGGRTSAMTRGAVATGGKGQAVMGAKDAPRGAKLYECDGKPAYWEKGKFPKIITPNGEKVVYELQTFFREASEVTPEEWAKLAE